MTNQEHQETVVVLDNLPFKVQSQNENLILSPKPNKNWSKEKRRKFEKENRTQVVVTLFDDEYFDRLNKIEVTFDENLSLLDTVKKISQKAVTKIVDILTI